MNRWMMIIFVALILTISKTLLAEVGRSPAVTCEGSEVSYNEVKDILARHKMGEINIINGGGNGKAYINIKGVPKDCAAMLEPKSDLRGEESLNFLAKPPVENKSPYLKDLPKFNNYAEAFTGKSNKNCDIENVNFQKKSESYSKDELWNCYFESELTKFLQKDSDFIRESGRAFNQKPWTRKFPKLRGYQGFEACIEFHESVGRNFKRTPLLELEENYKKFKTKFQDKTDLKIPITTGHFSKEKKKIYTYKSTQGVSGCRDLIEINQNSSSAVVESSVNDCFDCGAAPAKDNDPVGRILGEVDDLKKALPKTEKTIHHLFKEVLKPSSDSVCSSPDSFKGMKLTSDEKQQFLKSLREFDVVAVKNMNSLKGNATEEIKNKIVNMSKVFDVNSIGKLYPVMDESEEKELIELFRVKSKIDNLAKNIDGTDSKLKNIINNPHDFYQKDEQEKLLQCKSLENIHENDCKNFTTKATEARIKYLEKVKEDKKIADDAEVSVEVNINTLPENIFALDLKEIEPKLSFDKPGDINTEIAFFKEKLNKIKSSGLDCISNVETFKESDYADRITKLSTPVDEEDEDQKEEDKKYDLLANSLNQQNQMLQYLLQSMMGQNQNLAGGISPMGGQGAYGQVMGAYGMDSMNYMSGMMMNMYSGFNQSMLNMQSSQLDLSSQMQQMNFNNQYMMQMQNPNFQGNAGWSGGGTAQFQQAVSPTQQSQEYQLPGN